MQCRIFSSDNSHDLEMMVNTFLADTNKQVLSTVYRTHGGIINVVCGNDNKIVGDANRDSFSVCIFYKLVN
jgi:hypothetical protein